MKFLFLLFFVNSSFVQAQTTDHKIMHFVCGGPFHLSYQKSRHQAQVTFLFSTVLEYTWDTNQPLTDIASTKKEVLDQYNINLVEADRDQFAILKSQYDELKTVYLLADAWGRKSDLACKVSVYNLSELERLKIKYDAATFFNTPVPEEISKNKSIYLERFAKISGKVSNGLPDVSKAIGDLKNTHPELF